MLGHTHLQYFREEDGHEGEETAHNGRQDYSHQYKRPVWEIELQELQQLHLERKGDRSQHRCMPFSVFQYTALYLLQFFLLLSLLELFPSRALHCPLPPPPPLTPPGTLRDSLLTANLLTKIIFKMYNFLLVIEKRAYMINHAQSALQEEKEREKKKKERIHYTDKTKNTTAAVAQKIYPKTHLPYNLSGLKNSLSQPQWLRKSLSLTTSVA